MGDNLADSWKKQIQWYSDNDYFSELNRIDGQPLEFVERENSSVESMLSLGGVHRVVYELQVLKEGEKVREEVQEIERENQGEEKHSHEDDHVDGVKDSTLEPRCVCTMM